MAGISPWDYAKATEHSHQAALFMWANMAMRYGLTAANNPSSYKVAGHAANDCLIHNDKVPHLKWLHAIHNQGHGDKIRGSLAKAEGVKAGVYDVFLPVPVYVGLIASKLLSSPPYAVPETERAACGLYLELKVGKNTTSPIQNEFAADMRAFGYATAEAWGWLEARNKVLAYLGLPLYPD